MPINNYSFTPILHWSSSDQIIIEDNYPNSFSISPKTNVEFDSDITSNAINVSGFTSAEIGIVGGSYTLDNGSPTIISGTINYGQIPRVVIHSASAGLTSSSATLTIGNKSATFTITTKSADISELADSSRVYNWSNFL